MKITDIKSDFLTLFSSMNDNIIALKIVNMIENALVSIFKA